MERGQYKPVDQREKASALALERRGGAYSSVEQVLFAYRRCAAFRIEWFVGRKPEIPQGTIHYSEKIDAICCDVVFDDR